jgi:hypothetical protein
MHANSHVLELSIIIDSRIYAYLFAPIIPELLSKGIRVYVYAPLKIINHVRNDIGLDDRIVYLDLDPIRKMHRWRWRIHRVAMEFFVRDDFSFQFYKKRNEITMTLSPGRRALVKLSRFLPKVPNDSINSFLKRIAGFGMRNPFRTSAIMVGSLNASAELLCAKGQTVITIMESWDHVVKLPNGYTSSAVFVWNEDLKVDWERVQRDRNVHIFYPLKLRHARDVVRHWTFQLEHIARRPFFVYSVAGTRRFCIQALVDVEQQLIRDLARAAESIGWDLFIKPRPNGERDEFVAIEQEFSNVRVGSVIDLEIEHPSNYFLSDDYNNKRFSEIQGAKFVVNAFTTFGLDAAAAGIPVLQLDLRKARGYDRSNLIYENYHLKNYLLSRSSVLRIDGNFHTAFLHFLQSYEELTSRYAKDLSNWLFGDRLQSSSIEGLVVSSIALIRNSK